MFYLDGQRVLVGRKMEPDEYADLTDHTCVLRVPTFAGVKRDGVEPLLVSHLDFMARAADKLERELSRDDDEFVENLQPRGGFWEHNPSHGDRTRLSTIVPLLGSKRIGNLVACSTLIEKRCDQSLVGVGDGPVWTYQVCVMTGGKWLPATVPCEKCPPVDINVETPAIWSTIRSFRSVAQSKGSEFLDFARAKPLAGAGRFP